MTDYPTRADVDLVERVTGHRLVAIVGKPDFKPLPQPAPILVVELVEPFRVGEAERQPTSSWAWRTIVELCRRIEDRVL